MLPTDMVFKDLVYGEVHFSNVEDEGDPVSCLYNCVDIPVILK